MLFVNLLLVLTAIANIIYYILKNARLFSIALLLLGEEF